MKTYIAILALITITSCQLLKKTKLTTIIKSEKEELQIAKQEISLHTKAKLVLIDSSHNRYTMIVWPKGKFKFSVANGFEGEAEKILLKGKQIQQKELNLNEETTKDSSIVKANYRNEQNSTTSVEKNKIRIGFNWAWLLSLPIAYIVFRLYKWFRSFRG